MPNADLAALTPLDDAPAASAQPGESVGGPPGSSLVRDLAEDGDPADLGRPVFVDSSGRRGRRFRRLGLGLGAVCACYATVLVASLFGGHTKVPGLFIPGQSDYSPSRKVVVSPKETSGGEPRFVPDGTNVSPSRYKTYSKPSQRSVTGTVSATPVVSDPHTKGDTYLATSSTTPVASRSGTSSPTRTSTTTPSPSTSPSATSAGPSASVGSSLGQSTGSTVLSILAGAQVASIEGTG